MHAGVWSKMVGWDVWGNDMEASYSMEQLPNNSMPWLGHTLCQNEEVDQQIWSQINSQTQDQTWENQFLWIEFSSCHWVPWSWTIPNPKWFEFYMFLCFCQQYPWGAALNFEDPWRNTLTSTKGQHNQMLLHTPRKVISFSLPWLKLVEAKYSQTYSG